MLALAALLAGLAQAPDLPAARPCSIEELAELTARSDTPYSLRCQARLPHGQAITRPVVIRGGQASGAKLDCQGQAVGRPGQSVTTRQPTIAIWSDRGEAIRWTRPTDITISHCTIHGAIRIWGMGSDGSYDDLRASSRTANHTAAAQAAAPTRITLDQLALVAKGTIPLYIGPGVTEVTLTGSHFGGRTEATAIYLDAESARNRIENNRFAVRTGREVIAVDGSASNAIIGNQIALYGKGGIFLYRNCGERGVIRHQTPSFNLIADNVFTGASWLRPRLVVINARDGNRSYCGEDAGYPYGSSIDNRDNAQGTILARNRRD
ncbi:right-handed parallel beta-helix repeat-containing protein [Brevundimonas vesicularis]|uniref:right-handed parallel beta-helix repeat-containing protein n=1 Tax=Brevundimonas vesicularis TaxID=41276 RepID=UPI0038D3BD4E